jgi:aryl-alcohol dehydrogenase-like predicted oxidoreductase
MNTLRKRPLGNTGISVSEIGLGAWQLANPLWGMDDEQGALAIVQAAFDEGCNLFDTAPGYSGGRSEELLGRALSPVRDRAVICTKFGHTASGETNFAPSALQPALEESLRRLRTDYVDLYILHNPPADLLDAGHTTIYDEMERLKSQGKIRAYGVSLDMLAELNLVLDKTPAGVVEVLFNAFHQEPLAAFGRAAARGVGLFAKVPLDSGWLTGKYHRASAFTGIRERWPREIIERRAALVEKFAALLPPGLSIPAAALGYVLAQPGICSAIPGAKTPAQAAANFAAARAQLPPDLIASIRAIWEHDLKDNPLPW